MNPWVSHLVELRLRLLIAVAAVFIGAVGVYCIKEQALWVLLYPLEQAAPEKGLIFTGVPDVFFIYIKIAIYGGIGLAFPVLCWQIWGFVAPGLYGREKSVTWPYVLLTPVLFYTGVLFSYSVVMPLAIQFFFSFESSSIQALPALKEYFNFTLKMLLAFGISFTFPVAVLLLVQLGWVSVQTLTHARRFVLVGVFIAAAVLTPPDPMSQFILAMPLYVLFEGALFLARWFGKDTTKQPV
ncbi:MAG: twin-arginine translocase subunit TatC [Alphaproteobacteria bacterium]|nr:twin-arginine translocase subunit TatC [Alphaproteobacteria bacterium]MDD9920174.1 twin-arginine translocase subunit TatC [Alphaproteobacteria bacterium]